MSFRNPLLNEDILPEVFKYLTLRDRKNARLVCKPWLAVCKYEKFTRTEALFICNVYDYQTVVDFLETCDRKSLNLKFDQSLIDEKSQLLWKTCGKRIESLTFHKCIFRPRVIPQIFKLCVNMTEFSLGDAEFMSGRTHHRHPFSLATILLPKLKIVRPKLTALSLECSNLQLKSVDIRRFATTFPSLRTLKMNIELQDHFSPTNASSQSSNFAMLLELLEKNLKDVQTVDVHFATGIFIDVHLTFVKQHEGSRLEPAPLSLEPFFKVHKNMTESPFLKYCVGLQVDDTVMAPFRVVDLLVIARLLEENPLMEELDLRGLAWEDVAHFCVFFAALVRSRLKYITLHFYSLPEHFASELDTLLGVADLPINNSVSRLKIFSSNQALCKSCLKYFANIDDLCMNPPDLNEIFESQPNLKNLSIESVDDEACSTAEAKTIESLEFLEVHGKGLNLLSAYRFPNLKYFHFYYDDDYYVDFDGSEDTDYSGGSDYSQNTDSLTIVPTSDESSAELDTDLDTDDENWTDIDSDEDSESDDFNPFSAVVRMLQVAMQAAAGDSEDDLSSAGSPSRPRNEKGPLLGFLSMDLGERGDPVSSSSQDSTAQDLDADAKRFISKIDNIASFVCEKAPNLSSFRFFHESKAPLPTGVYTAFFKACSKFPKLRYLAVGKEYHDVSKAAVKAEILKHMTPCPCLRVVWFESKDCQLAVYFNAETKKLESSEDYFCAGGVIDLKNFHRYDR